MIISGAASPGNKNRGAWQCWRERFDADPLALNQFFGDDISSFVVVDCVILTAIVNTKEENRKTLPQGKI